MTNPTGKGVRGHDSFGSGAYQATRTTAGRTRLHGGIDFASDAGQVVIAPMAGTVTREAKPYSDGGPWDTGLWIESSEREALIVKMFYARPLPGIIGTYVREGDPVAIAISLQDKYPGITDHVHTEIWFAGRRIDPVSYFGDLRIEVPISA